MRKRAVVALLMLVLICAATGCGSLYNLEFGACCGGGHDDSHRIYGGVRHDLEAAAESVATTVRDADPDPKQIGLRTLTVAMAVVDLPLSVAVDTLTLPLVIPAVIQKQRKNAEEPNATQQE